MCCSFYAVVGGLLLPTKIIKRCFQECECGMFLMGPRQEFIRSTVAPVWWAMVAVQLAGCSFVENESYDVLCICQRESWTTTTTPPLRRPPAAGSYFLSTTSNVQVLPVLQRPPVISPQQVALYAHPTVL